MDNKFSFFVTAKIHILFYLIYKRAIYRAGIVASFKWVTHYGYDQAVRIITKQPLTRGLSLFNT